MSGLVPNTGNSAEDAMAKALMTLVGCAGAIAVVFVVAVVAIF